jgi:hypothetical protein
VFLAVFVFAVEAYYMLIILGATSKSGQFAVADKDRNAIDAAYALLSMIKDIIYQLAIATKNMAYEHATTAKDAISQHISTVAELAVDRMNLFLLLFYHRRIKPIGDLLFAQQLLTIDIQFKKQAESIKSIWTAIQVHTLQISELFSKHSDSISRLRHELHAHIEERIAASSEKLITETVELTPRALAESISKILVNQQEESTSSFCTRWLLNEEFWAKRMDRMFGKVIKKAIEKYLKEQGESDTPT